jgi:hypothetical protein
VKRDNDGRIDLTKGLGHHVSARQHAVALDDEHAAGPCRLVDRGQRGHVAAAHVLGQCPADDVAILVWVQRRHTGS